VTRNPFHAVTDMEGRFEIRGLPPCTWRLKLWHERLAAREIDVAVKVGQATVSGDVEMTLPPD